MKLIESKNLGFSKNGSMAVQYPLNTPAFDLAEDELDMTVGGENLYHLCVPEYERKPLNFVVGIEKAIARILFHSTAFENKNYGGWGFDEEGNFYADYYGGSLEEFNRIYEGKSHDFSRARRQIFRIDTLGKMKACCLDEKGEKSKLCLKTNSYNGSHTSSGVIYALMTYLIALFETGRLSSTDPHYEIVNVLHSHYKACVDAIAKGDTRALASADRCLDADIYTILAKDSYVKSRYGFNCLNLSNYDRDEFEYLEDEEFRMAESFGNSAILNGETELSNTEKARKGTGTRLVRDCLGEYILNPGRILTKKEEDMVPVMDDYLVNRQILNSAKLFSSSSSFPRPFRNAIFFGESGAGKSSACAILSQLLHLPYVFYTFNPDTMLSDLYQNVLPNSSQINREKYLELSEKLLDPVSISFDPVSEYERITGRKKEDASSGDCVAEILEELYRMLNQTSEFMYVESPLVQAFRYGWVCELQEANVASKPGVLTGINAALDDLSTIQLPTGEVIKRHPDTVIIMTANLGYEGTRAMSQAVKSRSSFIQTFTLPEDRTLMETVKLKSGVTDEKFIEKQIKVLHAIRNKLVETGCEDGVCGQREIIDWAIASKILDDPYEAALETIITKATSDPDVQPELVICLESQFKAKEES